MIEELLKTLESLSTHWIYAGAFLILMAENSIFLGAFIPGETIAFVSGFYASRSIVSPYWIALAITLGAVCGDSMGFLLGRKKGKKWLLKIGGRFGYNEEKFDRAEYFWKDHGKKAIIGGRFVAFARTFIPFLSGTSKIGYRTFLAYDLIGAIVWSVVHVMVGYFFGTNWKSVQASFGTIGVILFLVLVIVVYRYIVRKGIDEVEDTK